jgi:2-polyprenyl-6-methoxyphenol hydroxylase-like FAD-dependent oxidoreductase
MKVLVAGAGPTGLVLALWLAKKGIPVRIVDKAQGPGETSRAMAVQARTLELYAQLGFADEVVEEGIQVKSIQALESGHPVAKFEFKDLGDGLSPYPFVLSYPQDDHERLLGRHLKEAGIEIEWNTEVQDLTQTENSVTVTLSKDGQTKEDTYDYVCGCDGAHSVVRQRLGVGFPGGTYDVPFFVADVVATGEVSEEAFRANLSSEILLVFPIRSSGHFRLIGTVPEAQADNDLIRFEDIKDHVEQLGAIKVECVDWFSRYKVHHRVAQNFRVGRCFIAGDAGHIHSPAGGQGMNTGIGDAVNLAWKLAEVAHGADPSLLDTYEAERLAFAHSLVESTDRVFGAVTNKGAIGYLTRDVFLAHVAPFALGFHWARETLFKTVSQTKIDYRHSPLSEGAAGGVHGGDRLPWLGDNYAPLTKLEWQGHVYGGNPIQIPGLPIHQFPWTDQAKEAGFQKDALYVIRPDGYVALAQSDPSPTDVAKFLDAFQGRTAVSA